MTGWKALSLHTQFWLLKQGGKPLLMSSCSIRKMGALPLAHLVYLLRLPWKSLSPPFQDLCSGSSRCPPLLLPPLCSSGSSSLPQAIHHRLSLPALPHYSLTITGKPILSSCNMHHEHSSSPDLLAKRDVDCPVAQSYAQSSAQYDHGSINEGNEKAHPLLPFITDASAPSHRYLA